MWNPFSMFHEKSDATAPWSMTRVVAFQFSIVYNTALGTYAYRGKDIGWPFCVLGIVTLLAVPIQALFSTLQTWAMTPSGRKTVEALTAHAIALLPKLGGIPGTTTTAATTTSVTTIPIPTEPVPTDHGA